MKLRLLTSASMRHFAYDINELNIAITCQLKLHNEKLFQLKDHSRLQQFELEEKKLLQPLPLHPFVISTGCRPRSKRLIISHSEKTNHHYSKIIADLRKEKSWLQSELATESGVSREIIGKYERGKAAPSIEFAKRIADAFGVSLDYLAGEGVHSKLDKKPLKRMQDIESLKEDKKNTSSLSWMLS